MKKKSEVKQAPASVHGILESQPGGIEVAQRLPYAHHSIRREEVETQRVRDIPSNLESA